MFNIGGGELIVILLVALIVLGPDKLPEAARKVGNVMGELRRMSNGFQEELRNALDEPFDTTDAYLQGPVDANRAPGRPGALSTPVDPDVAAANALDEPDTGTND
jgi:sec-independent protein translocase protein TatB